MHPMQLFATRRRQARLAAVGQPATAILAAVALSLVLAPAARAAAPPPCNGVVQINDASGDGHHANTDVLDAWFSEAAGRLQAVIKVHTGDWRPMHVDSTTATWSMLFEVAGQQHFVRVVASKTEPVRFDHGTWTLAGGFVGGGPTAGEYTTGPGATATIDVPAQITPAAGTLLARPFVLTYESDPAEPGPVDRGPGGATAQEAAFGADYVVGSCQAAPPGGPSPGPGAPVGGSGAPATTTAVVLSAPSRLAGAGRVRASGRIVPARGGVTVRVTARPSHSRRAPFARTVRTRDDGGFALSIPLAESSTISAVAEGINAQTRTVTVRSTVRLTLRRVRGGKVAASGLVSPRLPGRVLLLRVDAVVPSATTTARLGRFRFPARRLLRGRYQAVFIPSGDRAERSTSRPGAVR